MLTRLFALASGFIVGGWLYSRWPFEHMGSIRELEYYQAALLAAGIGLAWTFSRAWITVTLSTCLAPLLIETVKVWINGLDPFFLPYLVVYLLIGIPAPLIGGAIGYVLSRVARGTRG